MSRETNPMRERDDIELLLPWYVTGRLSAEDRARVEAWLQRDPDLARQLPLAAEESLEARRSAEATPVPAGLSVERTLAKALAQERRQQKPAVTSRTVSQPGVLDFLRGLKKLGITARLGDPEPTVRNLLDNVPDEFRRRRIPGLLFGDGPGEPVAQWVTDLRTLALPSWASVPWSTYESPGFRGGLCVELCLSRGFSGLALTGRF